MLVPRRQAAGGPAGHGSQLAFDFEAAADARDRSLEQVTDHANHQWKDAALEAVYQTAREQPYLIVDDVWRRITLTVETHDLRAMGPVMLRAATLGCIAPTQRYQLSERVSAHRNPRRVWESLIWPGRSGAPPPCIEEVT
jgi:hypothetical protein